MRPDLYRDASNVRQQRERQAWTQPLDTTPPRRERASYDRPERFSIVDPTPLVIWSEDWPVVLVLAVVAIVVAGLGLFGAHGLGWL